MSDHSEIYDRSRTRGESHEHALKTVANVAIQEQLLELARSLESSHRGASASAVNLHFAKMLRQRAFEFRQRPERASSFFDELRKSREAFEKLADVTEHMANSAQNSSYRERLAEEYLTTATAQIKDGRHEPAKPREPEEIKTFPLTNMKVIPR